MTNPNKSIIPMSEVMPDPTDLTNEMRYAVYLDDCEIYDHDYSFDKVVNYSDVPNPNNNNSHPNRELFSGIEGQLPHIYCRRCGTVWIVIDEPGFGYDDALRKVQKRMGNPADASALQPKPKKERRREQRNMLRSEKARNADKLRNKFISQGTNDGKTQ